MEFVRAPRDSWHHTMKARDTLKTRRASKRSRPRAVAVFPVFAKHSPAMLLAHLVGDAHSRQARTSRANGAFGRHERQDNDWSYVCLFGRRAEPPLGDSQAPVRCGREQESRPSVASTDQGGGKRRAGHLLFSSSSLAIFLTILCD
jgi:hypothetical protein